MKKMFISFMFLMFSMPVLALNVEVEAMSDFSTDNPPETFSVKVVSPVKTDDITVDTGSIVEGEVMVKDAQRLKRDATFSFVPTILTTPDGSIIKTERRYVGKYKKELNKGKIAKQAALSAGNLAFKGLSTGYSAIEGMVKNEQGNRLKSSAVAVFDNSPLSYAKKGENLFIKEGEHFLMNFKLNKYFEDELESEKELEESN